MSNGYDPLAVAFYDIAHEGAQVRAIAGAIEASVKPQHDEFGAEIPGLASLAGVRARSIVVLCADNLSYRCAQLAASLIQPLPVALVITETIPGLPSIRPRTPTTTFTSKGPGPPNWWLR